MTSLSDIVATSRRVAETPSRRGKVGHIAACMRRLAPDEIAIGVRYLAGETRQGRRGIGYALVRDALAGAPALESRHTLADVDAALERVAAVTGPGSTAERRRLLGELLSRATAEERDFLVRLLLGELRQGALEGLMIEAIAAAFALGVAEVRRAAMFAGGPAEVAHAALIHGKAGLARFAIRPLAPVASMLAQPAEDAAEALSKLGCAALEWKLDGARVQVHKADEEVRVFTRNLNDVTAAVPEIVEAVRGVPAPTLILDGEAIVLTPAGLPQPFQVTMRRFGRKLNVAEMRRALPLSVFFFDCLHRDGEALIERPAAERFDALASALPAGLTIPRLVTREVHDAEAFFAEALRRGHEGIMAKSLAAPYEAGSRGAAWLKVKRALTLDLVVLAAEWGHGRRQGWLSNLHLGARDAATGQFVMLGKTFKGLTDERLAWQTRELLARELARDAWTVYVKPKLVVEVAFNELQASSQYPGGLVPRFARVKGYRPDKQAEQGDTMDTVRAIYAAQRARQGVPC